MDDKNYQGMELQILDNEAPVYADLKPINIMVRCTDMLLPGADFWKDRRMESAGGYSRWIPD